MIQSRIETFLECISDSFLTNDFEMWQSQMRLPLCLDLVTGLAILKSESDARRYFQDCAIAAQLQRVDTIIRMPIDIDECDDGAVFTTYETQMFRSSHRLQEPYLSTALLRPSRDGLVAGSILNVRDFYTTASARLSGSANMPLKPPPAKGQHLRRVH